MSEARIGRLEKKVMELEARLRVQEMQIERLEDKAWPIHAMINRVKRWKRGEWWWTDTLLEKIPEPLRIDNSAGKARAHHKTVRSKSKKKGQPNS